MTRADWPRQLHNGLGKVKSVEDHLGRVTTYRYDPFGNLVRVADPASNVITTGYDKLGRKTSLADPDLGTWSYEVDPLGRTWRQTDARAQVTTFTFDLLGRMTRRLEPDLDSRWTYDTAANGKGRLAEAYTMVDGAKDYQRIYTYDTKGREEKVIHRLDWDYSTDITYDDFSRAKTLAHARNARGQTGSPASLSLGLTYNNQGHLYQLTRAAAVLWTNRAEDPEGRTTDMLFGNGLETGIGFNRYTGRIASIETGPDDGVAGVTPSLQDDAYTYDAVGNLLTRRLRATGGGSFTDTYTYDGLDRLRSWQLGSADPVSYVYDAQGLGNLANKPGVGTYNYPAAGGVRPHAISSITGTVMGLTDPSFSYDENGNLKLGLNRGYVWTAANLPRRIDKLTNGALSSAIERTELLYGPERQRTRLTVRAMSGTTPGAIQRTQYYGGAIQKEVQATKTLIRTYLPQDLGYLEETIDGVAAPESKAAPAVRYFHADRQGSLIAISDASGSALARFSYDAWGRRRNPANGADYAWSSLGPVANNQDDTGYTGEEQFDSVELVHLNGRVYDPVSGRMTSADPTVPDPLDLQSLNRYSYVMNNPLRYTDPTGFGQEGNPGTPPPPPVDGSFPPFEINGTLPPRPMFGTGTGLYRLLPGAGFPIFAAPGTGAQQSMARLFQAIGSELASAGRGARNLATELVRPGAPPAPVLQQIMLLGSALGNIIAQAVADQGSEEGALKANGANSASTPPGGPDDDGDKSKDKVRFGKDANQESHAFRHVDKAGLDRGAVRDAIKDDLSKVGDSLKEGLYNGRVNVNGTQVDYAAYKFADGTINVGRITPPR